MTVVAAAILGLLAPFLLFDALRRPTIRRLAVRNVVRRPGEAALVVVGSLLATALITASFIIGDSFGASIRGIAADVWGPTDELVAVDGAAARTEATAAIDEARLAGGDASPIDATLGATYLDVAAGSAEGATIEPELRLLEADPGAAVAYAGSAVVDGVTTLGPNDVIVNAEVADDLGIGTGDALVVYADGRPHDFVVAGIAPATGLNGFAPLVAAPGALTDRLVGSGVDVDAVAASAVFVSNTGGTYTGADRTDGAVAAIEEALAGTTIGDGAEIVPVKRNLLDDAEEEAAAMTELFGTIGGFSVAAGILLVVNLFVMLAGERKSELGTLRAVGLRRGHLVRAFSLEGAAYGVAAAGAGVGVGIALAAVVMTMSSRFLDSELTIRLAVEWGSLMSGALIGLMVSQVTVLVTSWRLTRLNIVRAIKELPEPTKAARPWRRLAAGVAGVAGAGALFATLGDQPPVAMIAPVLAAVATIPLLDRLIPRRVAVIAASGAGLAWAAAVFGLMPDTMADPEIFLFLIQGIVLVALATVIVGSLDRLWLRGAEIVSRGGIAARIGLAEPLARRTRTALLVAMYALVIFTMTFMLVMNTVFQAQAPAFARQAGGGYEVYVDANAGGGLTAAALAVDDDIVHAAPIVRAGAELGAEGTDDRFRALLTGIDGEFVVGGAPELAARADGFATDADAWTAVAGGPTTAGLDGTDGVLVIDEDWGFEPGDRIEVTGPGGSRTLTVAGISRQGWMVDAEVVVPAAVLSAVSSPSGEGLPITRYYLDLADGADPAAVADRLTAAGVAQGVDARTFLSAAKAETDEQEGFLNLLQVYMGLGLLIGIAGLGVVMIRAVRERRRQFGVLRALGIASDVIRRAFLIEASFVALQGVVLGVGLGLLSSWQILTRSTAFEEGLEFQLPEVSLGLLAAGCLVASLIMAAVPAIRAGRVIPAEALRVAA